MYFCVFQQSGDSQLGGKLTFDQDFLINVTEAWPKDKTPTPTNLLELINRGEEGVEVASHLLHSTSATIDSSQVEILPPIMDPPKNVICVGRNYKEHIIEGNIARGIEPNTFPEHIEFFTKAATTINAHGAAIPLHADITSQLDYEAELGIIIGSPGKDISPEDALDHVFGYTIINDITARDLQRKHGQWFKGKTLDGSCPMGPWVVHKSAIKNANALNIRLMLNDVVRQQGNTGSMIFNVQTIIAQLSAGLTLEQGDIIATGTPSGVGYAMTPPQFLQDGDQIAIEIEHIGRLENSISAK